MLASQLLTSKGILLSAIYRSECAAFQAFCVDIFPQMTNQEQEKRPIGGVSSPILPGADVNLGLSVELLCWLTASDCLFRPLNTPCLNLAPCVTTTV
jgi:hypothetical protein